MALSGKYDFEYSWWTHNTAGGHTIRLVDTHYGWGTHYGWWTHTTAGGHTKKGSRPTHNFLVNVAPEPNYHRTIGESPAQ